MSETQYSYRYYDTTGCVGPIPKTDVLAKAANDLSVIPVERHQQPNGEWGPWKDTEVTE